MPSLDCNTCGGGGLVVVGRDMYGRPVLGPCPGCGGSGQQPARHRHKAGHRHGAEEGQHPTPAIVMRMLREHDEQGRGNTELMITRPCGWCPSQDPYAYTG